MNYTQQDVERALSLAKEAHDSINQRRKYIDKPYFEGHILPVVELARAYGLDELDQIVLAFHDTIEDVYPLKPQYDTKWIYQAFPDDEVIQGVLDLTDVYTKAAFPDWNRKKRHEAELKRLAKLSPRSKSRKLVDTLHNTEDIVFINKNDASAAGFAPIYLQEKMHMLHVFTDANPRLYRAAVEQVNRGLALIGHPDVIYG
jgi:(p)ppGpp synthase/HD superfamily hydrolase